MRLPLYEDLSLQIGHPAKERLPAPLGSTAPTYFNLNCAVGSFTSHKNQIGQSAVRQDPFWSERLSVQILTESVCLLLAEQKCEKWTA